MNSTAVERGDLVRLFAALLDPAAAALLPAEDPALVQVARRHRLSTLLSVERGASLPRPLAEKFRRDRVVTVARNLMLEQVAEECVHALGVAGVPAIVLKGLDYQTRLYAGAGARPTADVDLLVPAKARRAAFQVLDRLGFNPRAAAPGFDDDDYHEVAWARGATEVDLHMLLAPSARCEIDYDDVWRSAEPLRIGQAQAQMLTRRHAAVFHALHMAIDHFDVPAIYLVDLARLLPSAELASAAEACARRWSCHRPFITSAALTRAFLPAWSVLAIDGQARTATREVVTRFGSARPLPRGRQIIRKLAHFDDARHLLRYVWVQAVRHADEQVERRFRHRTARHRLGMPEGGGTADNRKQTCE